MDLVNYQPNSQSSRIYKSVSFWPTHGMLDSLDISSPIMPMSYHFIDPPDRRRSYTSKQDHLDFSSDPSTSPSEIDQRVERLGTRDGEVDS